MSWLTETHSQPHQASKIDPYAKAEDSLNRLLRQGYFIFSRGRFFEPSKVCIKQKSITPD